MPIIATQNANTGQVVIELDDRFTFDSHSEFWSAYRSRPAKGTSFLVDFRNTHFLDSAAMGMLLQLLDHVGGDSRRIKLVNMSRDISELFRLAEFNSFLKMS